MKRLSLVLFVIAVLLPLSALAQVPLTLDSDTRQLTASGHMSLLRDAGGQLTADEAMASDRWQALPGAVNAGYTQDAIWLRLVVQRRPDAAQEWVLRFTNALLDDVRLYRPDGAGGWVAQMSGENLGRANWTLGTRNAVLPVRMASPEEETWLVRLQSKNALSTDLELWPRSAFDDFSRQEYFYYGLYFGCFFLLILLQAFFWRMTREAQSGWYFLYVLNTTLTELLTTAFPQQLLNLPVGLSDPLLGLSICSSLVVGTHFSLQQLGLSALWPRFNRVVRVNADLVALVGMALVLSGRFAPGMVLVQLVAMANIVMIMSLAFWLAARGHKDARFFLLAFGIFYVGAVISFLRNMAVVPSNFWTHHASTIGSLLHMVLMSVRLNLRYDGLRRDKELAQAETVRAVRDMNENLEHLVAQRTDDLQQEIFRRMQLEQELRKALEVERRIKEEQQDFLAMVSHEFRTPLALISITAQQIAKNLNAAREKTLARCQKMLDAAHRMAALVDEYLSADRMDASTTAFRPAACDPRNLIADALAEWPPEKINTSLQALPPQFVCDKGLLHVALRNLLNNALRHSAGGQAIHLSAATQNDGALCLSVSNPGKPIPDDEMPRLFQKYFRGRSAQHRPGAGLGLYLVRRIAGMHGGEVRLANDAASGTVTFSLLLPARVNGAA
jgi:signal transduction histidine kinase